MDLDETPTKVNGPKNTVWKLMDPDITTPKVNGSTVHLTQKKILRKTMLDWQKREQDQPIPFDRKPYHCSSFNHVLFICAAHKFPSITFLCKS